jgi:hypothetical protein
MASERSRAKNLLNCHNVYTILQDTCILKALYDFFEETNKTYFHAKLLEMLINDFLNINKNYFTTFVTLVLQFLV